MNIDEQRVAIDRASEEAATAREAVLELLVSTLDAALPLAADRRRAEHLPALAALCARAAFLGEAAMRLGG